MVLGLVVGGCCSVATAGEALAVFKVRVALAVSVSPPSQTGLFSTCFTGSAASAENSAVVARRTEEGSYCLDGRSYRLIHFLSQGAHVSADQWGLLPISSRDFHVYYDPTLAPPERMKNVTGDGDTDEVLVVW